MNAPLPPMPPDDLRVSISSGRSRSPDTGRKSSESLRLDSRRAVSETIAKAPMKKLARHTVGIILLLVTVVLWTASNFLASVCVLS